MTPRIKQIEPGTKFGRWTVLGFDQLLPGVGATWLCVCECGTTRSMLGGRLRAGTKSCGCLTSEVIKVIARTHGRSKTPEYHAWSHMLSRCYTPTTREYSHYGGRGITVCDRWRHSFQNFFMDMGERPSPQHSLDRINNDGNYEPSNCRWATHRQQGNNKRVTRKLTFNGKTQSIRQWERELGFDRGVITGRLQMGWDLIDVFTIPSRGRRHPQFSFAKLKAPDVIAIRKDTRPQVVIAAHYGVKPSCISTIKSGKTWRHLL